MIPVIPTEEQVPVLETEVIEMIENCYRGSGEASEEVFNELQRRLKAGAAKYGTAWCEVNLTEDLREELLDAMNYLAMLLVRRVRGGAVPSSEEILIGMAAESVFMRS